MATHDHSAPGERNAYVGATAPEIQDRGARDSNDGRVPGEEFPAVVHLSVVAAFAWILLTSWLAFGAGAEADLGLAAATLLGVVLFALPIIMYKTATHHFSAHRQRLDDFLCSSVDTATGRLTGSQAWLQILIIPLVLAFAAVAIGAVRMIVA